MQKLLFKIIGLGLNIWGIFAPGAAAMAAYNLFCRPPKPRLRSKELQFLNTATRVDSQIAGQPVVEYHWGPANGPLVLLSYGWHYNGGRWRHFVPELVDAGFHVLAYDPPGHGLNQGHFLNLVINSEIIKGLIEKYGPAEALLAHSFGGASSVRAMSYLPESLRPRRAVVMASFSHAARIFEEYRDLLGLWDNVYYQLVNLVEKLLGLPLQAFDIAYLSSKLGNVQSLLVHAPDDQVTPYANALRYQSYWPDSVLYHPEGGGHHLGKAEITRAILSFLTRGTYPEQAETLDMPVKADHELVRYFAGIDV